MVTTIKYYTLQKMIENIKSGNYIFLHGIERYHDAGEFFTTAKDQLNGRGFKAWFKKNIEPYVDFKIRTAQLYIELYEHWEDERAVDYRKTTKRPTLTGLLKAIHHLN